jgi:uncharacterized protein (TIGR02996 family)
VDPGDGISAGAVLSDLWQACVAQPDDDALRGVLADALQACGDARGELIALQLLPADPDNAPARRARIRELVAEHGRTWLGPLRDIASGASFERGLVTRLELVETQPVAIEDHRELWSVEELVADRSATHTLRRVLESPAARSASRFAVDDVRTLDTLAASPARITHLACTQPLEPYGQLDELARRIFELVRRRESITSLAIWGASFPVLRIQPWFERLTSLTFAGGMRRGLAHWPLIPASMSLVIATTPQLDSCARAFPADCRLELRHDGCARVSGEWLLQSLEVLDALPASFTRLELEDTSEPIVDRIRRAVGGNREIVLRGLVGRAGNLRWS